MTKSKRIFVSNRLPFNVDPQTGEVKRATGGLVSALLGVNLDESVWWLGFETDQANAEKLTQAAKEQISHVNVQPVVISKKIYDAYYDQFCNDVLWPLFHYEGQYSFFHRHAWHSYIAANQLMAEAILKIANPGDTVWIHDFHFLLLPAFLRESKIQLKIGLFLHIPFPSSEIFRQLPVRDEILRALIQADLIGFHEHSYLRHFTVVLKANLGVDSTFFTTQLDDHTLHYGVYPISIDTEGMKQKAVSAAVDERVQAYQRDIQSLFLFLGIDRLDYTKGLELKLRGFRRALKKYPELRGQINLLQVAIPTRTRVGSYIRLKRQIDELVGTINGEFGAVGYTPVNYIFNSVADDELVALYRRSNALLVTSKRDGMNLVAIEYSVCQNLETPGVLILSEFAGAASLLGSSLIINPWDEDSIADAIYRAWGMPLEERRERIEGLQEILSKYSATRWALSFLKDLDKTAADKNRRPIFNLVQPVSRWPEDLRRRIHDTPEIHLILDYDGTLVGFKDRPEQALLDKSMEELLTEVSRGFTVHILSGRSKSFLEAQFARRAFHLAAEHGAFHKSPGEGWVNRVRTDVQSWYREVKRAMKAYTQKVPLSFIEEKEACLVWHFRNSPQDFAFFQAKKLDEELQVALANSPVTVGIGNRIIEAKAVECNKGHFLRWLMDSGSPGALYICIGDDRTDEDMFTSLGDQGISVKVGAGSTVARYRLATQAHVARFLQDLMDVRGSGDLRQKADSR